VDRVDRAAGPRALARAATPEQAIEQHGGEATGARDRFLGLSASERAALIAYVKTL